MKKKLAVMLACAFAVSAAFAPAAFAGVERYEHVHGQANANAQPLVLYLPEKAEGNGNSAHGNFAP